MLTGPELETLLTAFDAFLAAQGLDPATVGNDIGQFKACKCGARISCADIVACVENLLNIEAADCATAITVLELEQDGTIVTTIGTAATVTPTGNPGEFTFDGNGAIEFWEVNRVANDRFIAKGWGTKATYIVPLDCD